MTYVNWLPTLSGTSSDIAGSRPLKSGIKDVRVTFKDTTSGAAEENKYWESGVGGGWTSVTASTWIAKTGDSWVSWYSTYVWNTNWLDGHSYEVKWWSSDTALPLPGNEESINTRTFTYDITKPTAVIQVPVNNEYYSNSGSKNITSITGTAVDSKSGILKVEVALKEARYNGLWWNGTSTFSAYVAVWSTAEVTGAGATKNWTWNTPPLIDQTTYLVQVRAVDTAGNQQSWYVLGQSSNVFTYDATVPSSELTWPKDGKHYNSLSGLTGTAVDGIGLDANMVEYGIREYPSGPWWNGSTFTVVLSTTHWLKTNHNGSGSQETITFTTGTLVFQTNRQYLFRSHGIDKAGNITPDGSITDVVIVYDVTKPTATIVVPAGNGE
jgi:hypothetical protein